MTGSARTEGPLHVAVVGPVATEHLASWLAPVPADAPPGYAGAPLTAVLIGALLRAGHRVSAFTTDSTLAAGAAPVRLSGPGVELTLCPARARAWRFNGRRPGRIVNLFADERAGLARAIRAAAPDVVHAHWTYEFALAAIDTGLPHLVTCHDSPAAVLGYTRSPYRALRYLMAVQAISRARRLTAVSEYMAGEVKRHARVPIRVVANPLADYVLEAGRERAAPPTRRVAMVCNAWDRRKNPEPALQAFARFRQAEPAAELHLFGREFGPGETAQRWARERGLDAGMVFHGALPHSRLIEALNQSDLLLHSSREESFGVAIAEAMALGLPVVAGASAGAVPWVVGAEGGRSGCALLVDVESPAAIARALAAAFDAGYADRSRAGRVRSRASFTAQRITDAYVAEYRAALESELREAELATSTP